MATHAPTHQPLSDLALSDPALADAARRDPAGDPAGSLRRALLFVGVSGAGWLLDLAVFLALSGPAGWSPIAANVVSGSCGVLLVFVVSASRIFRRNEGSVAQKVAVLLVFNFAAILASSLVLGLLAGWLARAAATLALPVPPVAIRLAAKVLVTPFTLALNFVVVRFLVERFVTLRPTRGLAGSAR